MFGIVFALLSIKVPYHTILWFYTMASLMQIFSLCNMTSQKMSFHIRYVNLLMAQDVFIVDTTCRNPCWKGKNASWWHALCCRENNTFSAIPFFAYPLLLWLDWWCWWCWAQSSELNKEIEHPYKFNDLEYVCFKTDGGNWRGVGIVQGGW